VKVACHFPFWERKFYVIFALGSESSRERKFHPWNFRSREQKYVGMKVPVTRVRDTVRVRDRVRFSLQHQLTRMLDVRHNAMSHG